MFCFTNKFKTVLITHAPWKKFQVRKNFKPWISSETLELIKQREIWKQRAKELASNNVENNSNSEEIEAWKKYKIFRNKVNNRNHQTKSNFNFVRWMTFFRNTSK